MFSLIAQYQKRRNGFSNIVLEATGVQQLLIYIQDSKLICTSDAFLIHVTTCNEWASPTEI